MYLNSQGREIPAELGEKTNPIMRDLGDHAAILLFHYQRQPPVILYL